jgi:hypothetical protein
MLQAVPLDGEVRTYHRVVKPTARRRIFWSLFGRAVVLLAAWILTSVYLIDGNLGHVGLAVAGASVPLFALLAWRQSARLVASARTYQLTLGPSLMRVVSATQQPMEVTRAQVTALIELRLGLVVVAGRRRWLIPRDLGGYAEARAQLVAWRALETGGRQRALLRVVPIVLTVGLAVCLVPVPIAVVLAALPLMMVAAGWMIVQVARSTATTRVKVAQVAAALAFLLFPVLRLVMEQMR